MSNKGKKKKLTERLEFHRGNGFRLIGTGENAITVEELVDAATFLEEAGIERIPDLGTPEPGAVTNVVDGAPAPINEAPAAA